MDVQELEVIIAKDGQVRLQVRGVKGDACLELTQGLESLLGSELVSREMTPDALDQSSAQLDDLNSIHKQAG